jgi:hypothetical protein
VNQVQILYPIFAMFALTTFVVFRLGFARWAAVSRREINIRFFESYRSYDEPEPLRILSRHLVNLFETPVIFYVVSILVYVTAQTSPLLLVLAWLFVLTRIVHSVIHLTSNVVLWRFRVFGLSLLVLTALWMVLALKLINS